ncbi:ubiquitin-2 like Rad60 SUMO-like-domain-containing protein [Exophiala viscosa]|uniref:ubiquitin-2 like Rad60 SUMO-like-domain-containing protein n=1 Tax=Exophiala viscosa TaxID=2486360 RepID=UPI00219611F7|nr:ubiquitin-2 like Rad60 SUMO-like-domain-containing protein [Exophiala viscosa]
MTSGVKRSIFSKPAWAAAPAASSTSKLTEEPVFGRNHIYEDILQAEQAKREKKALKAARRAHKEDSKEESVGPEVKKRRISYEPATKRKISADVSDVENPADRNGRRNHDGRVTRSTPQKQKALSSGLEESPVIKHSPSKRQTSGLRVDEEDDDLEIWAPPEATKKHAPLKAKPNPPSEDDESDEDDEYTRDLKAKAREKARLKRLGIAVEPERPKMPVPTSTTASAVERTRSWIAEQTQTRPGSANSALSQEFGRATPTSEQEDDTQVKILIQSDIPNTQSLIVRRKASQSLKQVREFWCQKYGLDEAISKKVFFTWRGTRLFDSTTMRGIIQKLKLDYRQQSASVDPTGEDDDKDPSDGNILLEATTPEIYEEKLKQKQRAAIAGNGEHAEDEEDNSPLPVDDGAIVIQLVSPNLEPMHLRVRPHTTIAKIMKGYAATRNVAEGKTPWLIFDGDRLEPEQTVEDAGLEDEDKVEVSIR